MLWVYGHYKYFLSYSGGIDFRRQHLTSTDVKFYPRAARVKQLLLSSEKKPGHDVYYRPYVKIHNKTFKYKSVFIITLEIFYIYAYINDL